MSTRATISYGQGFHLYLESYDDSVHLELESRTGAIDFEASPSQINATIPKNVLDIVAHDWLKYRERQKESPREE